MEKITSWAYLFKSELDEVFYLQVTWIFLAGPYLVHLLKCHCHALQQIVKCHQQRDWTLIIYDMIGYQGKLRLKVD